MTSQVNDLREDTTAALESSSELVKSYRSFARMMDSALRSISEHGGYIFPNSDLNRLFDEISDHSSELAQHASQMQEKILSLVMMIDKTKEEGRKALWAKIWSWLIITFKVLAKVMDVGSSVANYIPHIGSTASSVMQAGSSLCSSVVKICTEMNNGEYKFHMLLLNIPIYMPFA